MNSLGIVARACLMEAEETRGQKAKKWAKRAALAGGVGLAALGGLGAYRGYKGALAGGGAMNTLKTMAHGAYGHMRHPLGATAKLRAGAMQKARDAAGWVGGKAKSAAGWVGDKTGFQQPFQGYGTAMDNMLGSGHLVAGSGLPGGRFLQMAYNPSRLAVGGAAAGAAGYGGYRAYKHYKAKKAKEAATRAYWETYNALMENDQPESGTRKWGRRALYAGGAAAVGLGGLGAARGAMHAYKQGKGAMDIAKAAGTTAKTHLMNPGGVATGLYNKAKKAMGY